MFSRLYRPQMILLSFFLCLQTFGYNFFQTERESFQIFVEDTMDYLSNNSFNLLSKDRDGMILSKFGFKVENVCFDKLGVDFLDSLKETMLEGLQCLTRMSSQNISNNITGSLKNAFDLANLVRIEDKIILTCSRDNLGETIEAAGSIGEDDYSLFREGVELPDLFILLNLSSSHQLIESKETDQTYLKEVLFHELMHNLGHYHAAGIEYGYTCGTCCFSSQDNKEKELACRICNGNYGSETDLEYMEDLLDYAMVLKEAKRNLLIRNIMDRIQVNYPQGPKDFSGQILLARAYLSRQHSIGFHIGERIKESQAKLTAKQMTDLVNIEEFNKNFFIVDYIDEISRIMANAFVAFYYHQDIGKAFSILEKHRYEIANYVEVDMQWNGGKTKNILKILKKFMNRIMVRDMILKTNTISPAAYLELKHLLL